MEEEQTVDNSEPMGELENVGADAQEAPETGEPELPDDIFSFSEADADEEPQAAEGGAEGEGEDGEFAFSEEADIPESYVKGLADIAKECGMPGIKGAQMMERAWAYAKAQNLAANKALGLELKKEWGSEFDAKLQATKSFAARLTKRAGLTDEQMEPMMSPYGIRLLNAMREMVQEGGGFAGNASNAPKLTAEQEIDTIFNTPELFRALTDPGDPKHDEVNTRLNRLMGIK